MIILIGVLPAFASNRPLVDVPYVPKHYGVVYPNSSQDFESEDMATMEEMLVWSRAHGIDVVIQTFPASYIGTPKATLWLDYLDLAAQHEIDVLAYLIPNRTYTPPSGAFNFDELKAFLDVVGDHPALLGFIGLHEPLEPEKGLSDSELRAYYAEIKSYAPHLKIAHYVNNLTRAEALRPDGWRFSDGMCDICIIWFYPCRFENDIPIYIEGQVTEVIAQDRRLIDERDPDAELWFLGQAFGQLDYATPLRFPSPEEMHNIYVSANQNQVEGFMWYAWQQSSIYDEVLGDPGNASQQEMIGTIASLYLKPPKIYVPLVAPGTASSAASGP